MEDNLLQQFRLIISGKTGIWLRSEELAELEKWIFARMANSRLLEPAEYLRVLSVNTYESRQEWKALMSQLTTGETYFFRDKGQFTLLKNWVLPELIKNKKSERTLQIWSAGCSTGEEAYSVAILLDEFVRELDGWKILILGTDINERAIDNARRGIYGEWSFRQVGDEIKYRYFRKKRNEWIVDDRIKGMVRFEVMNLIADTCPDTEANRELSMHEMDLIICRNVFIYFKPEIVSSVVEKISACLREGGYLMTGHAEIRAREFPFLKSKVFPESVVYQKNAEFRMRNVELKPEVRIHKPEVRMPEPTLPLVSFPQGRGEIAGKGHGEIQSEIRTPHSAFEQARACADRGRYDEAVRYCKEAIKMDPFKTEPYFLLAQIARDMGNRREEKEMLKKVIYLKPSDAAGFLELAEIYDEDGDLSRALKMRNTALELLIKLPPESYVDPYEGMTARELVEYVEKMVKP